THAERLFPATASSQGGQFNGLPSSAGTLVRVLEPPVKEGVLQVHMRSGCTACPLYTDWSSCWSYTCCPCYTAFDIGTIYTIMKGRVIAKTSPLCLPITQHKKPTKQ